MPSDEEIRIALRQVIDAEVGINIVDLGLVYGIEEKDGALRIKMTMTTRSCPLGELITREAEEVIRRSFPQIKSVRAEIVWEPPWNASMMSPAAKERLGG
ncbi:MAG: metal-sulfur cluster assembly factor [Nitrospinae bacterium]|nr:metal-sulfur cluster assembly factor [Nitrospinota bacterium]